ncbi:MAG: hypothetical protein K6F46_08390 [Desulfovibrio sp.]|nr:hypothetical protein [Desulfovibrio sp.]
MLDYHLFKRINDLFEQGKAESARLLLMELQSRHIALRDELDRLKIRLETLEHAVALNRSIFLENGFYWLKIEDGIKQGPFCPHCYDAVGSLIRLENGDTGLRCPCCGTTIEKRGLVVLDSTSSNSAERKARLIPFAR